MFAFSCEEVGLFGSSAYAMKHKEDMKNYLAYTNATKILHPGCSKVFAEILRSFALY